MKNIKDAISVNDMQYYEPQQLLSAKSYSKLLVIKIVYYFSIFFVNVSNVLDVNFLIINDNSFVVLSMVNVMHCMLK